MPFLPADLNEDRYRDIVASLSVWNAHLLVAVPLALFLGRKLSGWKDKAVLCWFVYDALIHTVLEGSFLWMSIGGTVAENKTNPFAPLWREYANADKRWAVADPTVVSIEMFLFLFSFFSFLFLFLLVSPLLLTLYSSHHHLKRLTVVVCTFLCILLIDAVVNKRPTRHFYQVTLSVMELYGGWMTFCPEWLSGSQSLDTSNTLYLWVYLWLANGLWVIIPLLLLWQSAVEMHRAFSVVGEKEEERRGGKRERQQKLKKIN
ncbi:EBP like [Balamuthia mandrillaris]